MLFIDKQISQPSVPLISFSSLQHSFHQLPCTSKGHLHKYQDSHSQHSQEHQNHHQGPVITVELILDSYKLVSYFFWRISKLVERQILIKIRICMNLIIFQKRTFTGIILYVSYKELIISVSNKMPEFYLYPWIFSYSCSRGNK